MSKKGEYKITADDVAVWLPRLNGNISAVADALDCSRTTVYSRIRENKWLQELLEDERERNLDELEQELYTQAKNGNISALIFALKTQGYKRGYGDRSKLEYEDVTKQKEHKKDKKADAEYLSEVIEELEKMKQNETDIEGSSEIDS